MNEIKLRGILTSIIIITFALVLFTGVGLYLSPSGKVAVLTNWNFFGIDKFQLENLHTLTGFVMSALVIVHLFLNRHMYITELRTLKKS